MSNTIDERIVHMQFDNKQFESGIKTSTKSLDSLKNGLKLDESAKSLSNLNKVGKTVSLEGISAGVDNLNSRFSTLNIIAITALQNIANSAIETGKRLVSSLTLDPITKGFEEYETKMNAITTILTNTKSKGTTLDDVNKALNELNEYADKTIYNFAEMTRNIGTFTAAGVDLKTSTTSIKGIANLAAGSGSSALQASTAMYQLSQAIASGTVKLMDWNSVVNAGMGGELFQKALEKTAKELGKGRDMSVSFRESLESGWITTEVLTKTLAKFAEDADLIQAATQVKTFTQMLDTMKESVQSGWAQSWETIIGNREEAAKFFTSINDGFGSIVGSSADARNSMLAFWKANGGRDAMIQALSNSFAGLQSVLKPIGSAFRSIFPATTGAQLVEFSKNFKNLSANFKIGEETSKNLKRTFAGLFAIMDIGKQAFFALGHGISDVLKYLSPAGSSFLSFTATIGDFFVTLDKAIKSTNAFNVAVDKIGNFMKPIADGVKTAVSSIINAFKAFNDVDMTGLNTFTERVNARFKPFQKLGELIQNVFLKIVNVVQKVAPLFYKLATIMGQALDNMRNSIIKSLDNSNFESVFDLINGGIFAAILLAIRNFINSAAKVTAGAGGFLKNITGILDGVKGSLQAYQKDIQANTLIKIAIAVGILSASLLTLSLIDSEKLTSALVAMGVIFVQLFGSMGIFEKIMSGAGFKGIIKITASMIALSTAILILTDAMTKLAKLDWNGIIKGLASVGVLTGILVQAAKVLTTNSGAMIKGATGFVIFAAAIVVLTEAVKKLGELDVSSLTKGLIGVGVLVTELALFMKVTNLNGMGITKGTGILLLSTALVVLSEAVKRFGELDVNSLVKGLVGVGVILTELALFVNLTGNAKNVMSTAIGLTVLGAAMLIFAQAVSNMGSMSWEQIGKGLLTMAVALTEITIAMKFMPKSMVITGTGLVIVASALLILSNALSSMGNMSGEQIAKSLITLAGALSIIAAAVTLMGIALPGAGVLLIISTALTILTPVLRSLGSMDIGEIVKGLLALAGVFVVLGTGALVLGPLVPVLLGLSAAVLLFGAGCLAVGVGILAFSAGLTALAISSTAGAAAITLFVTSIIGLIPFTAKTLAKGLVDFIRVIGESAPVIAEAVTKIALSIIKALTAITPTLIDSIFKILSSIFKTLVEYVPKITDAGMKLIIGFLKGIANNIKEVVETAIDVVINFIKGVTSKIGDVVQAGVDLVIAFINGLANAIRNNTDSLMTAIQNLVTAIIEAAFRMLTSSIVDFKRLGSTIMDSGLIKGIQNGIGSFTSAVGNVISEGLHTLKNAIGDFTNIGEHIVDGLINGIKNKIASAGDWAANLSSSLVNSAKGVLGIHSPSRVFEKEVGEMIGQGVANGIKNSSKQAKKESEAMAKDVFESAKEWIDERKFYNTITAEQELYVWEQVQKQYIEGTEERKKADKEVYRVQKEIYESEYNDLKKWVDERKYFNNLSKEEEFSILNAMRVRYADDADKRLQLDKEVYRLEKEMKKDQFDDSMKWLEEEKYYNRLSLEEELAGWERVQARYLEGTEERIKANREIYRLEREMKKARFDESLKWLEEEKYYNRLTLEDELAGWERIQKRYAQGTEERIRADKEVYRLEKEINSTNEEYSKKIFDLEKSTNDSRKKMLDDYYSKTKEINDKLKQDIQSVNKEYDDAVISRTNSLYNSYGLFDKVEQKTPVSGNELKKNLEDQVLEFDSWKTEINKLANKGVGDAFIKELKDMGPKSIAQIKALNTLSGDQLNNYVALWKVKHETAKSEAISELEDLRIQTINKINELKSESAKSLSEYNNTWTTQMMTLNSESQKQLIDLKTEWGKKVGSIRIETEKEFTTLNDNVKTSIVTLKTDTEKEFIKIVDSIQTIIKQPDWIEVGSNIIAGITQGVQNSTQNLITAVIVAVSKTLTTAKDILGINSPSKEFAKIGMYADQGMANGLLKFSNVIVSASSNVGALASETIGNAMSKLSDVLYSDLDLSPTIRPVLDLSNVQTGAAGINGILTSNSGMSLSSTAAKVSSIAGNLTNNSGVTMDRQTESIEKLTDSIKELINQDDPSPITVEQMNVREETDIKKIARELYDMQRRNGRSREVLI